MGDWADMFSGGGSAGVSGDYRRDKSRTTTARPEFQMAPEFEEAKGARKSWWDKLQQWGGSPGYGAIAPNWGDIWGQAKQRVRDYYWGDSTSSGMAGKIKASAARRGVSGSPALEKGLTKMGVEEGKATGDVAVQQALAQAQFGEEGRNTWLQSIMGLSGMTPQGKWWSPWQETLGSSMGVKGNVGIQT